jgi:hypothetical protein
MSKACRTHGRDKNAYKILIGKLEEDRPFGRPSRRWEDNTKIDIKRNRI